MARVVRQLSTNNRNQSRLKFHQEMSTNLVITNVQLFKHEALVANMSMELTHDSGIIIKVPFSTERCWINESSYTTTMFSLEMCITYRDVLPAAVDCQRTLQGHTLLLVHLVVAQEQVYRVLCTTSAYCNNTRHWIYARAPLQLQCSDPADSSDQLVTVSDRNVKKHKRCQKMF